MGMVSPSVLSTGGSRLPCRELGAQDDHPVTQGCEDDMQSQQAAILHCCPTDLGLPVCSCSSYIQRGDAVVVYCCLNAQKPMTAVRRVGSVPMPALQAAGMPGLLSSDRCGSDYSLQAGE